VQRVRLTVSEPWDIVSSTGTNVFDAEVRGDDGGSHLLLRLTEPVRWKGRDWHWFVAARSADATCSLYGLTEAQATAQEWREVPAGWRGESPSAKADVGG
jgi:hypothetical protein